MANTMPQPEPQKHQLETELQDPDIQVERNSSSLESVSQNTDKMEQTYKKVQSSEFTLADSMPQQEAQKQRLVVDLQNADNQVESDMGSLASMGTDLVMKTGKTTQEQNLKDEGTEESEEEEEEDTHDDEEEEEEEDEEEDEEDDEEEEEEEREDKTAETVDRTRSKGQDHIVKPDSGDQSHDSSVSILGTEKKITKNNESPEGVHLEVMRSPAQQRKNPYPAHQRAPTTWRGETPKAQPVSESPEGNSEKNGAKTSGILERTKRMSLFKRKSSTSQKSMQENSEDAQSKVVSPSEKSKGKSKKLSGIESKDENQNSTKGSPKEIIQSEQDLTQTGQNSQEKKTKSNTCAIL